MKAKCKHYKDVKFPIVAKKLTGNWSIRRKRENAFKGQVLILNQ